MDRPRGRATPAPRGRHVNENSEVAPTWTPSGVATSATTSGGSGHLGGGERWRSDEREWYHKEEGTSGSPGRSPRWPEGDRGGRRRGEGGDAVGVVVARRLGRYSGEAGASTG